MFWRSKFIGRRSERGVDRVLAIVTAIFAVFLLFSGESQACLNRNDAKVNRAATFLVNHQPATRRMTVVSTVPTKGNERATTTHCCGQCSYNTAASGHCPACAPALIASIPTLVLEELSSIYRCQGQPALKLIEPPPDFRPPRTFA
jgi:hypothetical protein